MKIHSTLSFFLLLVILISCQQDPIETNEIKTIELDEKSVELVEADNTFGLDLFQKIREESDDENIMVSPWSWQWHTMELKARQKLKCKIRFI